ncbi:MAG TPA: GAF domain-containing SpoIIE family protein phosphatase [Acidobacteriota bacterium]|nr:GAF domain-containing SpoIIE family protein phosphatase [Acidobacteriota bacterium]
MPDTKHPKIDDGASDGATRSVIDDAGADRLSEAESLIGAARLMHSTLRLSELYEIVVKVIARLTGSEGAVLLLHRPRTHHPVIFKVWDHRRDAPDDLPAEAGREFIAWLQERGSGGGAFDAPPAKVVETVQGAVSTAVTTENWLPLVAHERVMGAVGVLTSAERSGDRIAGLWIPLVEQITAALDNAILFRQFERQSLENQTLLDASRMLLSSLSLDEVLDAILDSMHRVLPFNAGGIFLVDNKGAVDRIIDRGYGTPSSPGMGRLERKARRGLVGWVAAHGEPLIVGDVAADGRYQSARDQTRSEMVTPIYAGERLVGILNLERDSLNAFLDADLDLVMAFAQHAGVAIERARAHSALLQQRHIKGELEVARRIQQTFLPERSPDVPGFAIAGINVPSAEVGGDYYDFVQVDEEKIGIAIADVAGKGIPAALIMAAFRASLIAEIRNNYTLRTIMRKVNLLLCERNDDARFVTAIYGILDTKNRIFTFSNAGHNPGILLRADGTVEMLHEGGTALGVFNDARFDERAFSLNPGDLIVLYTDGVTEMIGADDSMFEMQRLIDVLHENAAESPDAIIQAIRAALVEFADPDAPVDDLTLVVVAARR